MIRARPYPAVAKPFMGPLVYALPGSVAGGPCHMDDPVRVPVAINLRAPHLAGRADRTHVEVMTIDDANEMLGTQFPKRAPRTLAGVTLADRE